MASSRVPGAVNVNPDSANTLELRFLPVDRDELAARRARVAELYAETRHLHLQMIEMSAAARRRRSAVRAAREKVKAQMAFRRDPLLTDDRRARAAVLEAAFHVTGISAEELWLDYLGLGGDVSQARLREILAGEAPLPRRDHDRLAVALNERLAQAGWSHPLAYWDGTR